MVRALTYPFTFIFGPFVNDAIGATFETGISGGRAALQAIHSSCENRLLEVEADLVGLR